MQKYQSIIINNFLIVFTASCSTALRFFFNLCCFPILNHCRKFIIFSRCLRWRHIRDITREQIVFRVYVVALSWSIRSLLLNDEPVEVSVVAFYIVGVWSFLQCKLVLSINQLSIMHFDLNASAYCSARRNHTNSWAEYYKKHSPTWNGRCIIWLLFF